MSVPRDHPVPVVLPEFGVSVFESVHSGKFRAAPMQHDFWKLLLTLRGAGEVRTKAAAWACTAGTLIVVPRGQWHHLVDAPTQPMALLAVCVQPTVLDEPTRGALPAGPISPDPLLGQAVQSLVRRMLYEQATQAPGFELMLVGLAKQLLAQLRRQPTAGAAGDASASERVVRAYVEQLGRRFFEPIDLDEAARRVGLSRRRFSQLFRQLTGYSHQQYVRQLRIEHAKHLLARTERTIASIAFECGFAELSSFYRAFVRVVGCPPSAYRQMARRAQVGGVA